MAVAAEQTHSFDSTPLSFGIVASFVRAYAEYAERQHEKQHQDHQANLEGFNTFFLGRRWLELLKKLGNRDEAMHRLLALAKIDFRTWVNETLLKQLISEFTINVVRTPDGGVGLTDEYNALDLVTMTKSAIDDLVKKKKPTERFQADSIRTAKEIAWASSAERKHGDVAIDVSSWVSKDHQFYNKHSFIYVRQLLKTPTGLQVRSVQIKSFQSLEHIVGMLQHLGCLSPKSPQEAQPTSNHLSSMFFPIQELSLDQVVSYIKTQTESLPPREPLLPEDQEVIPKNAHHFEEAQALAERFFLDVVREKYSNLFLSADASQVTEEAINFAYRFLQRATVDENWNTKNPYADLASGFATFVKQKYYHAKLSAHEVQAAEAGLGGVLGSFGRVFSLADCGLNTFTNIGFGGAMQPGPYLGFTPDMLGAQFLKLKDECCPYCKAGVTAMQTTSGRVICSGCGHFYDMAGGHGHESSTHQSVREQKIAQRSNTAKTHHPQPRPTQSHDIYQAMAVDKPVDAFLTGFFL